MRQRLKALCGLLLAMAMLCGMSVGVSAALPKITITYYGNGGSFTEDNTEQFEKEQEFEINDSYDDHYLENVFYREGYSKADIEWNTSSDGTGTSYDAGDVILLDANTRLYAQWTPNKYTIKFVDTEIDPATGNPKVYSEIEQNYGTAINAPSPTKTGYTLSWDKTIPQTMPAENITLTAIWTPIAYNITYKLDGGSFNASTDNVTEQLASGTILAKDGANKWLTGVTKDGFNFAGWKVESGSDDTVYDPASASYTVSGNVTFTAQWSPITQPKKSALAGFLIIPTVRVYIDGDGTVTPGTSFWRGPRESLTMEFLADEGSVVSDVTINGESVGALESYTFDVLKFRYVVRVTFAPAPAADAETAE